MWNSTSKLSTLLLSGRCNAGQYAPALNLTLVQNGTLDVGPGMANLTVRAVANCTVNDQYLVKVTPLCGAVALLLTLIVTTIQ